MKTRLIITLLIITICHTNIFAVSQMQKANKMHTTSSFEQKLNTFLKKLTPQQKKILIKHVTKTALESRVKEENKVVKNPYSLILYKPTYILPFYYTASPDHGIYENAQGLPNTPEHQGLRNLEFKAQISVQIPVILHFFSPKNSLSVAYTQDSFWQVYAKSQYFRETNYEPEIFFRRIQNNKLTWKLGAVHQSNGRGGEYERSWNRFYGEAIYSRNKWLVDFKPWILIFKKDSSDLHNHDIKRYLGNSRLLFAYKLGSNTVSFMTRNNIQSGFKRGAEKLTWSFPLHGHFRGFVEIFSGYGQSLIEYNHYTNAFALGIALNDWI